MLYLLEGYTQAMGCPVYSATLPC